MDLELAYLAGFVDGEACIHVGRSAKEGRSYHRLTVNVMQNDPAPLRILARRFGGNVRPAGRSYTWERVGWPAVRMLRTLMPYLIVKGEQARLALVFQQQYFGRSRGARPVDGWETAERDSFAEAFKAIRGPLAA